MDFEKRLAAVRDELDRREAAGSREQGHAQNEVEEQLFQNGWPNCWGDFHNIMP
jgi:hypothetical protein